MSFYDDAKDTARKAYNVTKNLAVATGVGLVTTVGYKADQMAEKAGDYDKIINNVKATSTAFVAPDKFSIVVDLTKAFADHIPEAATETVKNIGEISGKAAAEIEDAKKLFNKGFKQTNHPNGKIDFDMAQEPAPKFKSKHNVSKEGSEKPSTTEAPQAVWKTIKIDSLNAGGPDSLAAPPATPVAKDSVQRNR